MQCKKRTFSSALCGTKNLLSKDGLKAQSFAVMLQGEAGNPDLSLEIIQTSVFLGVHQLCPKLLDPAFKIFDMMTHTMFHA